jgi:beta-glucanase (GH16 family)
MKIVRWVFVLLLGLHAGPWAFAQSWQLVWQDEFNGSIGPHWVFETGAGGWGNNELQYYRRENATIENNALVITARREDFGGQRYTSARMKTQGLKTFKYGRIEARIRLSMGLGQWPAFWMLGANLPQVGWPASGEIDIMERINNEARTFGTIHWQDHNNVHAQYGGNLPHDPTRWHVYAVEWDANAIKWFVDGTQYHEANIAGGVNGTSEFHNEFFLLLNFAIGGNWPGFTIDDSRLPARMEVDYVRAYQRSGTPTGVASVYQHCNYGGYSAQLSEGRYTLAQLLGLGVRNDDLSSLRVNPGYQVRLFEHDNFGGASVLRTTESGCLVDQAFNDRTSSLAVERVQPAGWSTTIEAEGFSAQSGVQTGPCDEGGLSVGWIDAGDWMAYANVSIPRSGTYRVEYRVASGTSGGSLSLDLNAGAQVLGQVSIPGTGGWQNWTTVSHVVTLPAGTHALGVYAQQGGWNLNWIRITQL